MPALKNLSPFHFVIGLLTLVIFLIDVLNPLGIAVAALYGVVILIAGSAWSRRGILALSVLHLALTLSATAIGHPQASLGLAFGQSIVNVLVVLAVAFLALRGQATAQALRECENTLQLEERRKDEFLATLGHKLRNPIGPINGAAYLLKSSIPQNEIVEESTDIIIRQSNHLNSLLDDLLDLARFNKKLPVLDLAELDMKRVISEAVEQIRTLIDAEGHQLSVQLPPQPVLVLGDHKRLLQMLSKLLSNAVKYTPAGGQIKLSVSVQEEQALLEITDSGIGISAELLPHVFELFIHPEKAAGRHQSGMGIGLALVKNIVELHGGSVSARSGGHFTGTTFSINLPRIVKNMPASTFALGVDAEKIADPLRIIVVDDNVDLAKMLAKFLAKLGHDATAIHSPQEALARAERETFDVYLLDIGLPGMDGNELVKQLRKSSRAASALMIAITGYGRRFDREKAFNSGFDHYFSKPVNPPALMELLGQWRSGFSLSAADGNEKAALRHPSKIDGSYASGGIAGS
jgi:signal transduction histidine kinase/CheY-like chemotaxis protein